MWICCCALCLSLITTFLLQVVAATTVFVLYSFEHYLALLVITMPLIPSVWHYCWVAFNNMVGEGGKIRL